MFRAKPLPSNTLHVVCVVILLCSELVGNTLATVKTAEEQEEDQKETQAQEASLAEPRVMSEIPIPQLGDTTASLTIAWGDGKLYYKFSLKPESKKLREGRYRPFLNSPTFTLIFYDSAGFKVHEVTVSLASMTQIVDSQGQPLELEVNDSEYFNIDDFRRVASWNVAWVGI